MFSVKTDKTVKTPTMHAIDNHLTRSSLIWRR